MKLVSACLMGICCRYDGKHCRNETVMELLSREVLIPVCPEQLGGLTTPREPMRIVDGDAGDVLDGNARVMNEGCQDVTAHLIRGGEEVVKLAELCGIREVIMKVKSPSCGCGELGEGVTTALLKRNKIHVITEEEL